MQCVTPTQVATLRATYGEPFGYKEPYPYKEKKLNLLTEYLDISKKRFNENTKVHVAFIVFMKRVHSSRMRIDRGSGSLFMGWGWSAYLQGVSA